MLRHILCVVVGFAAVSCSRGFVSAPALPLSRRSAAGCSLVGIEGSMGVDRRTALLTTAGAALGEDQRDRERERERERGFPRGLRFQLC